MEKQNIKAIICDFDQTLFDTRDSKPIWNNGTPDWDKAYSLIPECPLYDGWRYTLACLRNQPWGIVSHNVKGYIDKVLKYNKLSSQFDPVIGRYGEGSKRFRRVLPKLTLFEQAIRHDGFNRLNRNEILYMGDEASDVEQANEFGFKSAACYWGAQEPDKLDESASTYRLYHPSDLLELISI